MGLRQGQRHGTCIGGRVTAPERAPNSPDVRTSIQGFRVASVVREKALVVTIRNLSKVGSTVRADIISNQGNVDVYRSVDLSDFGTAPILANLPSGTGVVIDPSAPPEKAFYVLAPTGDPAP